MNQTPGPAAQVLTDRLLDEGIVTVLDAARAEGIRITSRTALRWCIAGVRGVRLESIKIRGRRMTSRAALRRFIAATQDRQSGSVSCSAPLVDGEAVDRILTAFGLGRAQIEGRRR